MYTLSSPLTEIKSVSPKLLKNLGRLGLKTVRDVLWHFPARYEDFSQIFPIDDLQPNQQATIQGTVEKVDTKRSWKKKIFITEAFIADETGTIRAVWFNQPYIKNSLREGSLINLSGKISVSGESELYFSNPAYEAVSKRETARETLHTGRLVPIYPETRGLTSKGIRYILTNVLEGLKKIPEPLPESIRRDYKLPEINEALRAVHFPLEIDLALQAKKRFAFEELFLLQLFNIEEKNKLKKEAAPAFKIDLEKIKGWVQKLPFALTTAQKKVLLEITRDLEKPRPMNRLIQGDVGSGKTVVALLGALIAAENGYQAALMAPTEILAKQHYETFKKLLRPMAQTVTIGLLTGSGAWIFASDDLETEVKKSELLRGVKSGALHILTGTHALIEKNVDFKKLGLVIVDEQHRFGVRQRQALTRSETTNPSESTKTEKIVEKELSYKLGGIFFRIQEKLGRFCRERQYADALEEELKKNNLNFKRENPISVADRISNFADFIIENRVIIELKAKPFITKDEYYQIKRYLETSSLELGLLINFQDKYLKPKRVLNPKFVDSDKFVALDRLVPHFLSMSATPIPRTLTLTIFGDLDLSIIDEMPAGRKQIITKVVAPENRAKAYAFIRGIVKKGRQVFVICPRIEITDNQQLITNNNESKKLSVISDKPLVTAWDDVKTVKAEYEKLSKKVFPDMRIAMLHGKMKPKEKTEIMRAFKDKKYDILVATSVIEVGIDVPNAIVILIEGAERFGLAQLYQFRGRVGRGEHQSFCLLFTDSSSKTTGERLEALITAKNGFELAERDLAIRGPGEFLGTSQTGLPDIAMRALQNMTLIQEGRVAAEKI
ncbi:MAG: GxxExxY protein, partial [bacterium]|nr:GxxExxY protein [bacterium]